MHANKVHLLVHYLDGLLTDAKPGILQLLLERDIVLLLFMWETSKRGNKCGKLMVRLLPARGQQAPYPLPGPLLPGTSVTIRPNGTKTVKEERSGPFTLTATADPSTAACPDC